MKTFNILLFTLFTLFAFLIFSLISVDVALAETLAQARHHYQLGVEHEEAGEFEQALAEYEQAQRLRPTFRLHRHMGRVCQALGRYADALEHYELYLSQGEARVEPEFRSLVTSAIEEVRDRVTELHITAPEGATIIIDNIPVGIAPLTTSPIVDEGRHQLEVRLEEFRDHNQEFEAQGGEELSLEIELDPILPEPTEPDESQDETQDESTDESQTETQNDDQQFEDPGTRPLPRRRMPRTWFFTTLGISLACLVPGAVLGGLALGGQDEFDAVNIPNRNIAQEQQAQNLADRGFAFSLSADILLSVGILSAIATVVLSFFTDFDGSEQIDREGES